MFDTDPRARLECSPTREIARWLEYFGPRSGFTFEAAEKAAEAKKTGNVMVTCEAKAFIHCQNKMSPRVKTQTTTKQAGLCC